MAERNDILVIKTDILVIKTGALGDVLRTTSVLPGLHERHGPCRVVWITAPGAVDLVRHHPLVAEVLTVRPSVEAEVLALDDRLSGRSFARVLSFDDERPLCRLASRLAPSGPPVLSGAHEAEDGTLCYTPDTAPWFDMGLLSVFGKEEADRRKKANTESHPAIFARMLNVAMGEPELPLGEGERVFAASLFGRSGLDQAKTVIGLNTGAGGRWESKKLGLSRTVRLAEELSRRGRGDTAFLLLGGPDEAERNAQLLAELEHQVRVVDAGTENSLLRFAALVDHLDLLVTSDSLALHVGVARRVPILAFFAPTSAAEIELYGRGEKVASTAPDACSYRPDADTSTLTVERLVDAALRVLSSREMEGLSPD